jgi:hypothetical protein
MSWVWADAAARRRSSKESEARDCQEVCIARKAIPRVRPPVCCVQYAGRGGDIASIPTCTQCLHATNGLSMPAAERCLASSGRNRGNSARVLVSYRTFSHARAFRPYSTARICDSSRAAARVSYCQTAGYDIVAEKVTVMPVELALGLPAASRLARGLNMSLAAATRLLPRLLGYQLMYALRSRLASEHAEEAARPVAASIAG